MARDSSKTPRNPQRAGINPNECPKKKELVEALLRGENPEIKKAKRVRQTHLGKIYDFNLKRWFPYDGD